MATPPPFRGEAYRSWLDQNDVLPFMRGNVQSDRVVIHASLPHVYLHAVFVPVEFVDPPDTGNLLAWQLAPSAIARVEIPIHGWIAEQSTTGAEYRTEPTCMNAVLIRRFDGVSGYDSIVEILQPLVVESNLFFMRERNAWCRLDKRGDIEKAIEVVEISTGGSAPIEGEVVIAARDVLDRWCSVSGTRIVIFFDFSRFDPKETVPWVGQFDEIRVADDQSIHYRYSNMPVLKSQSRGFQIVQHNDESSGTIQLDTNGDRKYEEFIAWDWKNQRVEEISCNPDRLANYFTDSDLPYETTPAFFNPEVLLRFKNDHEKYNFSERSISSRAGWVVDHYDINDASQVHVYLSELGQLPHSEQLHWKGYNEKPKSGLSVRAIKADFEGDWRIDLTPLESLKEKLRVLRCDWWRPASEEVFDRAHSPVTQSSEEWTRDILALYQLIVEGFDPRNLRKKAKSLGQQPEANHGSISLIRHCLLGLGVQAEEAGRIVAPFTNLREHRNILAAHATGEKAKHLASNAIERFSSYPRHYENLVSECSNSLQDLIKVFGLASESDAR